MYFDPNKIKHVELSEDHIVETNEILRKFGKSGYEGLVLWLGKVEGGKILVEKIITPPQTSIRSLEGVGYRVSGETLFKLNLYMNESGLRLIAQIHSHPSAAYHSDADDKYAVATRQGSFSLVVPNFAAGPASLNQWAIYQLKGKKWKEVSNCKKDKVFLVTGGNIKPEKVKLKSVVDNADEKNSRNF
jgi:hypothetical protein